MLEAHSYWENDDMSHVSILPVPFWFHWKYFASFFTLLDLLVEEESDFLDV